MNSLNESFRMIQGMNYLKFEGLENLEVVYFLGAELSGNFRGLYVLGVPGTFWPKVIT